MRRTNTKSSGLTNHGVIMSMNDTEDDISSRDESDGDSSESEIHDRRPKKRRAKFKSGNNRQRRRNPILS